jgi:hypothetical protein
MKIVNYDPTVIKIANYDPTVIKIVKTFIVKATDLNKMLLHDCSFVKRPFVKISFFPCLFYQNSGWKDLLSIIVRI